MVKFIDVDPEDVPNIRESHRGRVSYPILKSFMETGKTLVMLDRTGMQNSLQSLTSCLTSYIRNHELPIKLFMRRGELYLCRMDLDDKGNPITKEEPKEEEVSFVTPDEVEARFLEEKGQTTK